MRKARVRSCLPRGGWDHRRYGQRPAPRILIPHSMGGGQFARLPPCDNINISIHHPPRGVGTGGTRPSGNAIFRFQSTHPVGGGTDVVLPFSVSAVISIHPPRGGWDPRSTAMRATILNFNPPTPWGVGLPGVLGFIQGQGISIHPPRGGWDYQRSRPVTAR